MSEFGAQVLALLRKAPSIANRVLSERPPGGGHYLGHDWLRPEFLESLKDVKSIDEITRLKLAALSQARPEMREIAMRKLLGQASSEGLLPSELFHGTGTDAIKGIASSGTMKPQVSWQEGNKHLSSQTPKTYWATDPKVAIGMALESAKTGSMREELRHQALSSKKFEAPAQKLKNLEAGYVSWVDPDYAVFSGSPEQRLSRELSSKYAAKLAQQWKLEPSHPSVTYYALDATESKLGSLLSKLRAKGRSHVGLDRTYQQVQRAKDHLQKSVNEIFGLAPNADPSIHWGDSGVHHVWSQRNVPPAPPKPVAEPALIRARLKALLPHMDQESKNQLRMMLQERLSAKHDALTKPYISHEHVGPLPYKSIYELRAKGEIPAKMLKAEAFKEGEWIAPKSRKQVDALMALAKKLLKRGR